MTATYLGAVETLILLIVAEEFNFKNLGEGGVNIIWLFIAQGSQSLMPIKVFAVAFGQVLLSTAQSANNPRDPVITSTILIQIMFSCCNIFSDFDFCQ